MPRALPTQRLPSRSSKSAETEPRGRPSRAASGETPAALTRSSSPEAVPTQMFDPRSLTIDSACTLASAAGTPAVVISVPVQRTMPLSVPIHTSCCSPGSRLLILRSGKPCTMCTSSLPRRLMSPASRVPSQTSPAGASAIEITTESGRVVGSARVSNRPPRSRSVPLPIDDRSNRPSRPRTIAVTSASGNAESDVIDANAPSL